jgi:hypothetical protein
MNLDESFTSDNVLERALGGHFAGWSAPNDFFGPASVPLMFTMQGCCNGHGTRALYMVWQHAVIKKEAGVYVNLLFSRDTRWAEVNSYLPYEGKLIIRIHDAPVLHVRVPDWVDKSRVIVKVNEQASRHTWASSYVNLVGLRPLDVVSVTFPIKSQVKTEEIKGAYYIVEYKGDTVVQITPQGTLFPLYLRDHIKSDVAPMRTDIAYLVPTREVDW